MNDIQNQNQHKYEEFNRHVSLWNIIPSGSGNSLVLLRKVLDGIQSGTFEKNPTLVISGEGARDLAYAFANSYCSEDIREIEAQHLYLVRGQSEFFLNSLYDTVHIIENIATIGMSESILWHVLKKRIYKTSRMDGSIDFHHITGIIVMTAGEIKSVPPSLYRAVDFKAVMEHYTQEQLELIVHQRLVFCRIDYQNNEDILKTVIEYSCGKLNFIYELLKVCILLAQLEHGNKLDMKTVQQAFKLSHLPEH